MAGLKQEDASKWINLILVLGAVTTGYVMVKFTGQLGEWFDLEARVANFEILKQVTGFVLGLATFIILLKHDRAYGYVSEVYNELVKVVWPDKDSTIKLTILILIGTGICSAILVGVDLLVRELLDLVIKQ